MKKWLSPLLIAGLVLAAYNTLLVTGLLVGNGHKKPKGYKYQLRILDGAYNPVSKQDTMLPVVIVEAPGDTAATYTWVKNRPDDPWANQICTQTGSLSAEVADSLYGYAQQLFADIPVVVGNEEMLNVSHSGKGRIDITTSHYVTATITFDGTPSTYRQIMACLLRHSAQPSTNKNARLE
ncbi:hypothetical protein [Hymenobacter metallicola]|uniref:Uncharacterized protein n=1 Tax=Hymenobacter metallicola TaxID=2563114 RepID=A0A4Z0Q8Z6_9BACT|nr:hypothetical protein [Hymenobacter metallicola]TGE26480.1 hypothetical protein E5K02_16950 [Hymenobacter metallicola]